MTVDECGARLASSYPAVKETSNLLLALVHATWLGQAFAHCPLKAQTDGGD
jgi:hypothetical protein